MNKSFVYKNIYIYRFILNVLYSGDYRNRFVDIITCLETPKTVVELCFGDIYIAKYCADNNIDWCGFDLNESFVRYAQGLGYKAELADLMQLKDLPQCEACLMQGSLYHFHDKLDFIFNLVFASTKRFIISEPIKNISSSSGLLGRIARVSANAGNGAERFRYTEFTLIETLDKYKTKYKFDYKVLSKKRDIVIEINTI